MNYNELNLFDHIYLYRRFFWQTKFDQYHSVFWQRTNKFKVICEETENSEYIMHSLGALDDSCFMAFPNEAGQYVSEQCLVQSLYSSQGGPPTWSQWWSKYCCIATSPSIACRVNCGWTLGLCYLSLPPDHRDRGLRRRGRSPPTTTTTPRPTVNPPPSALPVLVRKPANSSRCLWAGLNLAEPHVFQAKDKPLTPLWSRRRSEDQREWGAYWSPCHRMTPSVSFPLIQDIRQSVWWDGATCSDNTYWNNWYLSSSSNLNHRARTRGNTELKQVN